MTPTHDRLCTCDACTLVRMYDADPAVDRDSQRAMALRWESIEAVLADTASVTNSDRDSRTMEEP